jgi:germination protein M
MRLKIGRKLTYRAAASLFLLLPLLSACAAGGAKPEAAAEVDPPPALEEAAMLQQADEAAKQVRALPSAAEMPEGSVTVYLMDAGGLLAPMTLRPGAEDSSAAESVQAMAETALAWLTENPARKDQLPEGFSPVLPAGVRADSVRPDTESGTVSIDFAEPLPPLPGAKERKLLESIVWSMTELPGINKVKLTVQGTPIRSLAATGLPVDETLTRGIGINVEHVKGVPVSRSMGVTLYFAARTESGDGYFVPVTRLVSRTQDRNKAALQELIKGPSPNASLLAVLPAEASVDELTQTADTVRVALRDPQWKPEDAVPSRMMEALVLTLTESAGAPQVKVTLNGADSFEDSDRRTYDKPVTRPASVNRLER